MPWCYQRGFSQWFFFGIAVVISSTAKVLSSKNISLLKHATQFLLNNMVTLLMGTRYFREWHQACVNALPTRTTVFFTNLQFGFVENSFYCMHMARVFQRTHCFSKVFAKQTSACHWTSMGHLGVHAHMLYHVLLLHCSKKKKGSLNCAAAYLATRPQPT